MSKQFAIPYRTVDFVIPAGETRVLPGNARWVEILNADLDTIEVAFLLGRDFSKLPKGILVPLPDLTSQMTFRNYGVATATITVATGSTELPITDNRLVILSGTLLGVDVLNIPHVVVDAIPEVEVKNDAGSPLAVTTVGGSPLEVAPAAEALPTNGFDVAGTTVIVAAGANVNGVDLVMATINSANADGILTAGGIPILAARTGAVDTNSTAVLPRAIRIPAGTDLTFTATGFGGFTTASGAYNFVP
jgi:hypothetical protein